MYKKRKHTSGAIGHLYESNLLSFIVFRALHDDNIKDFCIGSNLDSIGELDDIGFRFKSKAFNKPIAVFIQAKHICNERRGLTIEGIDLLKYYNSYLKIRDKFKNVDNDILFEGSYDDVECVFVHYTTEKNMLNKDDEVHHLTDALNDVIGTADGGFRHKFSSIDVARLRKQILHEEIKRLGADLGQILASGRDKCLNTILRNELVSKYNVLLAQKVFEVSDIVEENDNGVIVKKYRTACFKTDFLNTSDEELQVLRDNIFAKNSIDTTLEFKFPDKFGSMINGDQINRYVNEIVTLLNKVDTNDGMSTVVELREGKLAWALGNLLVLDETTKLLMFNSGSNLKGHAKTLFEQINSEVDQLQAYRFTLNDNSFPDLSFACNEDNLIEDFTNRLIFYTNQVKQRNVGALLTEHIHKHENNRGPFPLQITPDTIRRKFYDSIEKWWMDPGQARYITKIIARGIYQEAKKGVINKPLLSKLNVSINRDSVKFKTDDIEPLKIDKACSKITIVLAKSDVVHFSVTRVTQHFKQDNFILLDLNHMIKLSESERKEFEKELSNVRNQLFILYIGRESSLEYKQVERLRLLCSKLDGNKRIVVTTRDVISKLNQIFTHSETDYIVDNSTLVDLTDDIQKRLFSNAIIFLGFETKLETVLDEQSKTFIKGEYMNKIMDDNIIVLGKPLTDPAYEEIQEIYIRRRVRKRGRLYNLETFDDLEEHTVLIVATPGMGKSCLLTRLSLNTKQRDPEVWIVRFNFLKHSKVLDKWQKNGQSVTLLMALTLICVGLVDHINDSSGITGEEDVILKEENGAIILHDDAKLKEAAEFEIRMFLHHCNRRRVIFLCDGFDEICPTYEAVVIQLLEAIDQYRRTHHRLWITSRNYNKILDKLERHFGESYTLQPLSCEEQEIVLEKIIRSKTESSAQFNNDFTLLVNQLRYLDLKQEFKIPMHLLFLIAWQYFRSRMGSGYLKTWVATVGEFTRNYYEKYKCLKIYRQAVDVMSTPLHLHIVAQHLQSEMAVDERNLNAKNLALYKRLMNTIFTDVYFVGKCNLDLDDSRLQPIYDSHSRAYMDMHKRLAAYGVFSQYGRSILFDDKEMREVVEELVAIETGKQNYGVVHSVVNDVPMFVDRSFAEYFAAEYICDLLKSERCKHPERLWAFILNSSQFDHYIDVLNVLDHKLEVDVELKDVISERYEKIIFQTLLKQSASATSPLRKALADELHNVTAIFVSTFEYVDGESVQDFVEIVVNSGAMRVAVKMNNNDFICMFASTLRRAASSRVPTLLELAPDLRELTIDDIIVIH